MQISDIVSLFVYLFFISFTERVQYFCEDRVASAQGDWQQNSPAVCLNGSSLKLDQSCGEEFAEYGMLEKEDSVFKGPRVRILNAPQFHI